AVKEVSLQVKEGELFGLIGPDGAGKTTLMRSVCTLLKSTSGTISVLGHDTAKEVVYIRSILGYMPQRFSLYQDLSVEQNLRFFANIFKVPEEERNKRISQLYHFSRLGPFKKRKAGDLSGGMKQKLALSCALIHTPQLLILDEPTFGVDPVSRQEFWEILNSIREEGTTILVSTAYMDEADLCDRVALMYKGEIVAKGTPQEIRDRYSFLLYRLTGKNTRKLRDFFSSLPQVHTTQLFGDAVHISFKKGPLQTDWKKWQEETAGNLEDWKKQPPSIEDVFMELSAGEEA
ncbi:MAG: ABC transporter ATP-binding protein, partial [Calditrichia bacterium]